VFTTKTKCRSIAMERNTTEKQKKYTHLTFAEAVHFDYDQYTAECHAADWHMKFLDDAKIFVNQTRYY
jgi:hypothetical protein